MDEIPGGGGEEQLGSRRSWDGKQRGGSRTGGDTWPATLSPLNTRYSMCTPEFPNVLLLFASLRAQRKSTALGASHRCVVAPTGVPISDGGGESLSTVVSWGGGHGTLKPACLCLPVYPSHLTYNFMWVHRSPAQLPHPRITWGVCDWRIAQ